MNYLAHLYLADEDPQSIIGNLMGDFVKGPLDHSLLSPPLRQGIRLHRKIDTFTDHHPVFRHSKQRLRPELRRFAGVVIDMLYDHCLAVNWSHYSARSLRRFSDTVYVILKAHHHLFPVRMQRSVNYMLAHDLLFSYREIDGIQRALQGLEGRLRRRVNLRAGAVDLQNNYHGFNADFAAFFPELMAYVAQQKQQRYSHTDI